MSGRYPERQHNLVAGRDGGTGLLIHFPQTWKLKDSKSWSLANISLSWVLKAWNLVNISRFQGVTHFKYKSDDSEISSSRFQSFFGRGRSGIPLSRRVFPTRILVNVLTLRGVEWHLDTISRFEDVDMLSNFQDFKNPRFYTSGCKVGYTWCRTHLRRSVVGGRRHIFFAPDESSKS